MRELEWGFWCNIEHFVCGTSGKQGCVVRGEQAYFTLLKLFEHMFRIRSGYLHVIRE